MAGERTSERAEYLFDLAFRHMDHGPDRGKPEGQYDLYMAMGMQSLAKSIRQVYDKLEEIERKLTTAR